MRKKKQLAPHYNVKTSLIYEKSLILSCRKNRTNCMKVWRERVEKEKGCHKTISLGVHVQENQPGNSTSTSGKNLRSLLCLFLRILLMTTTNME